MFSIRKCTVSTCYKNLSTEDAAKAVIYGNNFWPRGEGEWHVLEARGIF
jgi:hypothetical protein